MALCSKCEGTGYMTHTGLPCEPCRSENEARTPHVCLPCARNAEGPALHTCGK
jgi:DnaJ-class molecular chaperone